MQQNYNGDLEYFNFRTDDIKLLLLKLLTVYVYTTINGICMFKLTQM